LKNFIKLFIGQKLLIILTLTIAFVWIFGDLLPYDIKSGLYSISLSIKWLITFIIPAMIIVFMASVLSSLSRGAFLFIVILISLVLLSNFAAVLFSYGFFNLAVSNLEAAKPVATNTQSLQTLWQIPTFSLLKNDTALLLGLSLGLIASFWKNPRLNNALEWLKKAMGQVVKFVILPLLPLFVLGTMLKLQYDDVLSHILVTYDKVFLFFCLGQFVYAILLFSLAAGFSRNLFSKYLKNIFPAFITGLTTISSAATMPVTIIATEKNTGSSKLAHTIIPATVNIHLLGTAIGMNILILSTFSIFGYSTPEISTYLPYALYFAIAQLAVMGVPGGSVFTMMPIVEAHLGATPEMLALISTMVILFDPFDTSINVTCNGAFAIIFRKILRSWSKVSKTTAALLLKDLS
jgi:Na+/H+-dicarboxylate symporter